MFGEGTVKKNCMARSKKENMSQMHDFGNFWCDLGWFGDVLEWFHNAESQCVITWSIRASKVTTEYLVRFSLLGCFQFYPESISIFHISRLSSKIKKVATTIAGGFMVESRWYNTDIPKNAVFLFHNSKKWRNVFVKSVNFLIQQVGVQSIWILILYPSTPDTHWAFFP